MISTEQPPRRTGLIVAAAATTAALFVLGVFVHQRHYNALTQMSDMTSAMTASDPLSTYYGGARRLEPCCPVGGGSLESSRPWNLLPFCSLRASLLARFRSLT